MWAWHSVSSSLNEQLIAIGINQEGQDFIISSHCTKMKPKYQPPFWTSFRVCSVATEKQTGCLELLPFYSFDRRTQLLVIMFHPVLMAWEQLKMNRREQLTQKCTSMIKKATLNNRNMIWDVLWIVNLAQVFSHTQYLRRRGLWPTLHFTAGWLRGRLKWFSITFAGLSPCPSLHTVNAPKQPSYTSSSCVTTEWSEVMFLVSW